MDRFSLLLIIFTVFALWMVSIDAVALPMSMNPVLRRVRRLPLGNQGYPVGVIRAPRTGIISLDQQPQPQPSDVIAEKVEKHNCTCTCSDCAKAGRKKMMESKSALPTGAAPQPQARFFGGLFGRPYMDYDEHYYDEYYEYPYFGGHGGYGYEYEPYGMGMGHMGGMGMGGMGYW